MFRIKYYLCYYIPKYRAMKTIIPIMTYYFDAYLYRPCYYLTSLFYIICIICVYFSRCFLIIGIINTLQQCPPRVNHLYVSLEAVICSSSNLILHKIEAGNIE